MAKSISLTFLQFSEILLEVNTGDSESGSQQVPLRILGGTLSSKISLKCVMPPLLYDKLLCHLQHHLE